jgi:PTH1 family peptidyl-tRNA hydrolase
MAGADYVLRRPSKADRTELDIAVETAADAVESIVADGFDATMNHVNTR